MAQRLNRAIATEGIRRRRPFARHIPPFATVVGLVLVVMAVAMVAVRPSPAEAALGEIARAAAVVDHGDVGPGSFHYMEIQSRAVRSAEIGDSERLTYYLSTVTQRWLRSDGVERQLTRVEAPEFLHPGDEAIYEEAGLASIDQAAAGDVTAEGVVDSALEEDWATNRAELDSQLRSLGFDSDMEIVGQVLDILGSPLAGPDLRGAALEVLAGLDLELSERNATTGSFSLVGLEGRIVNRLEFTLSSDGILLSERRTLTEDHPEWGLPAGAVFSDVTYVNHGMVDDIDQVP